MKWTVIAICLILSLVLAGSPVAGQDKDPEHYYGLQIEKQIDRCERKALLINSGSEQVRLHAHSARKQADYYTVNKDRLVQEMAQKHLKCREHKVNTFLIEAYNAENGKMDVSYTEMRR
jgi:hypothetical protein